MRQEREDKVEAAASIGKAEEEQIKEVLEADLKVMPVTQRKPIGMKKRKLKRLSQFIKPRRCRSRISYP